MTQEYKHLELQSEVESIGGRYTLDAEERIPVGGREALAVFGVSFVDRSCCGMGGCRFANVPGYVVKWKDRTDADGRAVSVVEPIEDEAAQRRIEEIIKNRESYCQVNFL